MAYPERQAEVTEVHRRGIRLTVAVVLIFVAVVVSSFVYKMAKPRGMSDSALRENNAFMFEAVRNIGDFALVDDNGEPFTPADLQGKWSLLFFGFTYCPDVCPTTMAQLNQFYKELDSQYSGDTQIIMVSVDPARDDAAKLHEYVRYFNPQFRGVTGEFLALQKFATSLNVPFVKVPGGGENYQIEHSGNIVIVNPQGYYVGFFKAPHELAKLHANYRSIRLSRDR
ncbi:MAG: SCO family protein [Spongiibacteraceae bacterium]